MEVVPIKKLGKVLKVITASVIVFVLSFSITFLINTWIHPSSSTPDCALIGMPEGGTPLLPGETFECHPAMQNTGKGSAIPFMLVTFHSADGGIPVYEYETHPRWSLVKEVMEGDLINRVYGYDRILDPGDVTAPLTTEWAVSTKFDFHDLAEDGLGINISIYVLQPSGFENATPLEQWEVIEQEYYSSSISSLQTYPRSTCQP